MTLNVLQVNTVLLCKNSMLREGLKHTLLNTRFNICSNDLLQVLNSSQLSPGIVPILVVVDVNLHQAAPAGMIQNTKNQHPAARVVVIADDFNVDCMMLMLKSGADGYCLSTIDCEVLVKYLDLVMLGETVFPSAMLLETLSAAGKSRDVEKLRAEIPESLQALSSGSPIRTLSSREAEILHCLMQGAPNKIIARKLEVAEATVKVHIKAILRKIRVTNRTQAAMWAVAHLPATNAEGARAVSR
jgi:two-component system nitrate/nitrite response regulator NarL